MADNYTSVADVDVRADQFDLTADPQLIPDACVADGDYDRVEGITEGYKVLTASGWAFPKSTNWIVVKGDNTFVVDDTTFNLIFTAIV